eukprot:3725103-Rhodomonas_salina.2
MESGVCAGHGRRAWRGQWMLGEHAADRKVAARARAMLTGGRRRRCRGQVRGGVAGGRVLALLGGGAAPRGADGAAQRARDQPARARPERLPPQRPQGLRQRLQVRTRLPPTSLPPHHTPFRPHSLTEPP